MSSYRAASHPVLYKHRLLPTYEYTLSLGNDPYMSTSTCCVPLRATAKEYHQFDKSEEVTWHYILIYNDVYIYIYIYAIYYWTEGKHFLRQQYSTLNYLISQLA